MAQNKVLVTNTKSDLNGTILQNAATEATLLRLVEAMEKKKAGSGDRLRDLEERARRENIDATEESTDANRIFSETLEELNEEADNLNSTFARISGAAIGTIFTALSAAGSSLTNFFLNSLDSFRKTTTVGGAFNNSLVELRKVASSAAIPLDMFTENILKNSNTFAFLGGTVSKGAREFANLSNSLRVSDLGTRLMGMGFTMEDLNEGLADYITLQMRLGRSQEFIQRTAVEGTKSYLMELDKLSKATGISRKAIEDEAAKASLDPVIQAMSEGADPAKLAASLSMITQVGGEELKTAFQEVAVGVRGNTEFGETLRRAGLGMEEARAIFEGQDPEKTRQLLLQIGKNLEEQGFLSDETVMFLRQDFRAGGKLAIRARELANSNAAEAEAEQANREKITEALASFAQEYQKIVDTIKLALIESNIFKTIENSLTSISNAFLNNKDDVINFINEFIRGTDNFITNFLNNVENTDIGTAIKDSLLEIITKAGKALFNGIKDGFLDLFRSSPQAPTVGYNSGQIDPGLAASIEMPEIEGGLLEGLDINWEGIAIGIGAVAAGLGALALVVGPLSVPILAVGAAIGMSGAGLGYLMGQAADAIDAATNSLSRLPDILKEFENINTVKMDSVGTSLRSLSGSLTLLAGAGIVSLISGDGIANLGRSLALFDEIDANKLKEIGPAMSELPGPLALLAGAGIVSLISGDGIANLGRSLALFDEIDANKLKEIGPAMSELPGSLTLLAGAGIVSLISGDGIANLGRSLALFDEIDANKLKEIGPAMSELPGPLALLAGAGIVALISGDGIANLGRSLALFDEIDTNKLKEIGPAMSELAGPITTISTSGIVSLISQGSIKSLAESLKEFELISPDTISSVAPALETLHTALKKFTGDGDEGILSSLSGAFSNWLKGDNGISNFAESFQEFNKIDSQNINSLVVSLEKIKELVELDYAAKANYMNDFAAGIRGITNNLMSFADYEEAGTFSSAIANFFGSDTNFDDFLINLDRLNNLDVSNVSNLASGISELKTVMDSSFATQVEGIETFSDAVETLVEKLQGLEEELRRLGSGTRTARALTAISSASENLPGGNTSSDNASEQQRQLNITLQRLIEINEEMNETTKDLLRATRGRLSPI